MNEFLVRYFLFNAQMKLLHWQTKSYARHKAFEEAEDDIEELVDSFIESYQGKYGRVVVEGNKVEVTEEISLKNLDDINVFDYIGEYCHWLIDFQEKLNESDGDLKNLLDGVITALNKTIYLLSLS